MALRVGLTGGIGSGKTTVAKMFELLNIPVYYADAEAKRLYENDPELNAAVKKHFGNDVFTSQGLNHSKLASIVFNNPRKLELLNQLVHPVTIRNANAWMQKQTTPYAIKEAALLFESNAASSLDYIVGVSAPANLRIKRAMERDNLTKEEVLQRMRRQIDEEIKMKLCDFIIVNNEQQPVIPQILELHKYFLHLACKKI
jgi:dephospho-CoA kinase